MDATGSPRDRAIWIRDANDLDAPHIEEVARSAVATLRRTYWQKPDAERPALPARARVVAILDHQIVGTVEHFRDGDRIHLIGLFVHETKRRHGVARALVAELIRRARAAGAQRLSLYTIRETGNVEVFERLGFRVVDERVDPYTESDRHVRLLEAYMELPLGTTDTPSG
jgi:GNAT superfamily N-acetyltransferase